MKISRYDKPIQQLQKYKTFFQVNQSSINNSLSLQKLNAFQQVSEAQLESHNISILKTHEQFDKKLTKYDDFYIAIRKSYYHGLIYIYDVIIGSFYLRIKVLNLQRTSDQRDDEVQNRLIGRGGFGTVRAVYIQDKSFAIKRLFFKLKMDQTQSFDFQNERADHSQIKKSIRQYSIYKICSMLGIGPKIIFNHTYDLICFSDCIQFQMELCEPPFKNVNIFKQKNIQRNQLQRDLKLALKKMHEIKFIHKDIKPENILYSPFLKRFVLADFGMTHTISQQIWQNSFTSYQGTLQYSSPQMLEIFSKGQKGYANLYYNDVHALNIILEQFNNNFIVQAQEQVSRNSMSFAQSFSQHISYEIQDSEKQQQQQMISQTEENWLFESDAFGTNNSNQINTGSSFPILSTYQTNSMEGPVKYASQINFYQAQVINIICKKYLDVFIVKFSLQNLTEIVDKVCFNAKFEQIKKQVLDQILILFYPPISNQSSFFAMMNLRNTSRNYGPYSQQTIYAVQQYINLLQVRSLQECQRYKQILKYLKKGRQIPNQHIEKDLSISISLNNYRSKVDLTLFQINETLKNQQISQQKKIKIIQLYIQIARNESLNSRDQRSLNRLFSKFMNKFYRQSICQKTQCLQIPIIQTQTQKLNQVQNEKQSKKLQKEQGQQILSQQHYKLQHESIIIKNNEELDQIFIVLQQQLRNSNQIINHHHNIKGIWDQIQQQKTKISNILTCYQILYKHSKYHQIQTFSEIFLYIQKQQTLKQCKIKLACIFESQIEFVLLKIQELIQKSIEVQKYMKFVFIYLKINDLQNTQKKIEIINRLKHLACKHNKKAELLYVFLIQNQAKIYIQQGLYKKAQILCEQFNEYGKQNILKRQSLQILTNKTLAYINLMIQNFQQAKMFYQKSIQLMFKTNFSESKIDAIFECFKNLIYIYKKLNIKEDLFKLLQKTFNIFQKYQNKQEEIIYICISTIHLKITQKQINWNHNTNTLQDQFLREVVETLVRVSIKVIYKYSIIGTKKSNLIQNIQFEFLRSLQLKYFQAENHQQLMLFNKYLCSVYRKYLPLTQWLYRTRSLKIAQYLRKEQKHVQASKYLWVYLQKVFLNVLSANQSDFILMNIFVTGLINQNSFRKALYYLKKYVFHIPPAMYLIKKTGFALYNKLAKLLDLPQTKYLKLMIQNDYYIIKFRYFDWILQFQENQKCRIKNKILKKWIKKW